MLHISHSLVAGFYVSSTRALQCYAPKPRFPQEVTTVLKRNCRVQPLTPQ